MELFLEFFTALVESTGSILKLDMVGNCSSAYVLEEPRILIIWRREKFFMFAVECSSFVNLFAFF
jgi:hypothetical protein